jgi:hypothetical protein
LRLARVEGKTDLLVLSKEVEQDLVEAITPGLLVVLSAFDFEMAIIPPRTASVLLEDLYVFAGRHDTGRKITFIFLCSIFLRAHVDPDFLFLGP